MLSWRDVEDDEEEQLPDNKTWVKESLTQTQKFGKGTLKDML